MSEDDPGVEDGRPGVGSAQGVSSGPAVIPNLIQGAIQSSAAELARSQKADEVVPNMLALIGTALGACQIKLYQNNKPSDDLIEPVQYHSWHAANVAPRNGARAMFTLKPEQSGRLMSRLASGEAVQLSADAVGDHIRQVLKSGGVSTALFVPVFVDGHWWGEAEIDRCDNAQAWSDNEVVSCNLLSGLIGAAGCRRALCWNSVWRGLR